MKKFTPRFDDSAMAPLKARRLRIHTDHEAVVFMRSDSPVGKSEGLASQVRVSVRSGAREIIATLYQVDGDALGLDEAGLSESAWAQLGLQEGNTVSIRHQRPVDSYSALRRRIFGLRLDGPSLSMVIDDMAAGRYSDVHIGAFLTACTTLPLDLDETRALTRAMVETGVRLEWPASMVLDKHCVGGLPGNRTTPLVVAIVAAHGLLIPKTSSRAITSPAGTADTMETLAPVDLPIERIRQVVDREGGCVVWGGSMQLSPADDVMIRVQRALDLENDGQMVASVLSKKIAAGATHMVIDIPVGPTAKVRSPAAADHLQLLMESVARDFGIELITLRTDGRQPVGRGIGPALEARDLLAILRNEPHAPADLKERSCRLAGILLEMGGKAPQDTGYELALKTLEDGRAWQKFMAICEAQGGMREPPVAPLKQVLRATEAGRVCGIDNRKLARLAKLAGAPESASAGLEMLVRLDENISPDQPLCVIHSASRGELEYALAYAEGNPDIIAIEPC
ncbi:thymidine phosphorylase family protein [Achromobacter sp. F4_2707]|uniref:thymidine phosphorylase family protein n=1 Tax=Achromobacter sp. F4_2707 TaxID=3114286 RepID=UPI0039C636AD